jgi:hypothetical protein
MSNFQKSPFHKGFYKFKKKRDELSKLQKSLRKQKQWYSMMAKIPNNGNISKERCIEKLNNLNKLIANTGNELADLEVILNTYKQLRKLRREHLNYKEEVFNGMEWALDHSDYYYEELLKNNLLLNSSYKYKEMSLYFRKKFL